MKLKLYKRNILGYATVASYIVYMLWRVFFTIPFGYGWIDLLFGIILLITELFGMLGAGIHFYNMTNIKVPVCPVVDEDKYPDVDVFITTYNESAELLYKTVIGCKNMDYPDKSKVHIYLCDDTNRESIRKLTKRTNIGYITRTENTHAKAGNLNNAMSKTNSPLIVTFDADMIPMSSFLMKCVPYFLTDKKIGFIQTPQSFYNPDLFQYNLYAERRIPNEQDYFYRDIQISRNKTNSVIYGGSNTVISRYALDETGGFITDVITEDFATGLAIQANGYTCYALPDVLASGLSPADLKSLIKQRKRWARGCIQSGRKLHVYKSKNLSFMQKLNFYNAISYWHSGIKRLVYIISPLAFALFGITVVDCTLTGILCFWLPYSILLRISLSRLSGNRRTSKWTHVYETIMFPSILPAVLMESLGISEKKFSVTNKSGAEEDKIYQLIQTIPHFIILIFNILGMYSCIRMSLIDTTIGYLPVLYWLTVNTYCEIMAIFFMLGRKVHRKSERVKIEESCILSFDDKNINCFTYDLSDYGVSIILDFPMYIPYDREISIFIDNDRYKSSLSGRLVNVRQIADGWKYSFTVKPITDNDYAAFINLIYDRIPDFPLSVDENGMFRDITSNIRPRISRDKSFNKLLPRIKLNMYTESTNGIRLKLIDFNYEYILVQESGIKLPDSMHIKLTDDVALHCKLTYIRKRGKFKLYKVTNFKSLIDDDNLHSFIRYNI